ncbi:MAG: hypothetical protein Ct9H90mP6_02580 [Gammaproteobacteria bacterium]|nr:MAG: hypothetical protein Ct9H90mP6_02580 [Gammaproteobacteria bacterium]
MKSVPFKSSGNGSSYWGAGRIYASTTNALINTGDGLGMTLRAGFPAQGYGNVAISSNWYSWCRVSCN